MRKHIVIIAIIAVTAVCSYAQPRADGFRIGTSGFELDYQHNFQKNQFLEGCLGVDFGYNANGKAGVKATAIYNFIWARPAWTEKGSWALYAGPGITIGGANDSVHLKSADGVNITNIGTDIGFILGICGQVGLEYTFWFPLQLSIDLRPVVGMHANSLEGIGFYDNGLLGFAPSISARFKF